MADDDTLIPEADLDDSGNPRVVTLKRADIRALEKQAKKARDLEERLATMERERAFMAAGVPVDDPAARYFVKGYDGELTPDAIKAAAVEARVIAGAEPTSEEIAGHQAAQAAAAGAEPVGVGPNLAAKLAEMAKKEFGPADEVARQNHVQEIARLARDSGLRIPLT